MVYSFMVSENADGTWYAEALALPDCAGFGSTIEEAIEQARRSTLAYIRALVKRNIDPPREEFRIEKVNVTIGEL